MSRPAWACEAVDHALQEAAYHCRRELRQLSVRVLVRVMQELRRPLPFPDRRLPWFAISLWQGPIELPAPPGSGNRNRGTT